jgi:hypothetical protein
MEQLIKTAAWFWKVLKPAAVFSNGSPVSDGHGF